MEVMSESEECYAASQSQLDRIEAKLDLLLNHFGIMEHPVVEIQRESAAARALAEWHHILGDERGRGNLPLRLTLHQEEHRELEEAIEQGDRAAIARELADVLYIAYGTAHALAIDLDVAFAEVHRAAMSKIVGPGLPIVRPDGKILKPPGFVPPDMSEAIGGQS
jgi:phosphoribosyl-ATP pyrophosphohydrolase